MTSAIKRVANNGLQVSHDGKHRQHFLLRVTRSMPDAAGLARVKSSLTGHEIIRRA